MQIQWWEGAALSCAEAVPQSTTHDTMRHGSWLRRESIVKRVVEEAGRRDRLRGKAQRYGACGRTQSFRIGESRSCRSRDPRWRTKLDFSSGESFDDHHRLHHTWGSAKDRSRFGGGLVVRFAELPRPSSWKQSGKVVARLRLARKPKLRMRTKPSGSRCNRKRRKNSSSDRGSNFCSLL